MMSNLDSVLHFDTLVWHWPIAIYLFLAGVSAGATLVGILTKRKLENKGLPAHHSGIVQGAAAVGPLAIMVGLMLLVLDLTKPLEFWKIMVFYNPTSVMSLGVIAASLYIGVLLVWLLIAFAGPLQKLDVALPRFVKLVNWLCRHARPIENTLALLAIILGAYTGFLLSALKGYPMLNNPILPILFLVSGVSSGIGASILMSLALFKHKPTDEDIHYVHHLETPVVITEAFLLFAFFIGLAFAGGQSLVAAKVALGGGFWSAIFWGLVVVGGMLVPAALNRWLPERIKQSNAMVVTSCLLTLVGVFALRHFVLYAGQMTVA
ncbi:cytochrome c nitrite reductase subunit NrfD [Ferrimonas sp. YFM]|uniref:cytochrome c nitrite reductase subunit NrfD n=1 Tax=Ferrimonas sp. YFM TaxID=3028878 RepID=UPI002573A909|nr:cytochrome c nitrite reductase subunit NrfD [Ferrimonas sp. YFM]